MLPDCPSVMLRYTGHLSWVNSNINIQIITLGTLLLGASTLAILSKGTPKNLTNLAGTGVGSLFSAENLQYLWKGAKQDQAYHWLLIEIWIHAFDWHWNQWPWIPWTAITVPTPLHNKVFFGANHENLKKNSHCQQRRCSQITLVSGNIKFMWMFVGVPWRGGVNDSEVIESRAIVLGTCTCTQAVLEYEIWVLVLVLVLES